MSTFKNKTNALYMAVKEKNISRVKQILEGNINIHQLSHRECSVEGIDGEVTPLDMAIILREIEMVEMILIIGKTFTGWKEFNFCRAMKTAAQVGDITIVELLLRAGEGQSKQMATEAVRFALQNENFDLATYLIKFGADINWIPDEESETNLEIAARKGDKKLVKLLIEELKKDRDACNSEYINSIFIAAKNGHKEVYEYLLPLISSIEDKEYAKKELLQGLTYKQRVDNKDLQAYLTAIKKGETELVHSLVKKGIDINCFLENGMAAIHLAVGRGSIEMVAILADSGANLDLLDENETVTPLMIAVSGKKVGMVKELIERGANVNVKNSAGVTALLIAEQDTDYIPSSIRLLLLKAGATRESTTDNKN